MVEGGGGAGVRRDGLAYIRLIFDLLVRVFGCACCAIGVGNGLEKMLYHPLFRLNQSWKHQCPRLSPTFRQFNYIPSMDIEKIIMLFLLLVFHR